MEAFELRNAFRVIAELVKGNHEHAWALSVRAHIAAASVETEKALLDIHDGTDHLATATLRLLLALEVRERTGEGVVAK